MIGQVKLGDFHVDLIILDKQNVEADKLFSCDPCLYFLNPLSLAVNVKRKPEYIRRSDALLARYLDRALHFSISSLTIDMPRPVPLYCVLAPDFSCVNGWNSSFSINSLLIPMPLSVMRNS